MWIVSLEKATADLKAFEQLAGWSRSALERVQSKLKLHAPVVISECHQTLQEKDPGPKLSRKRLEFNNEWHTNFHKEPEMKHECMSSW